MVARSVVALIGAVAVGCSPPYDWREVRIADARASLLFPCKPNSESRRVAVAEREVVWTNHACRAGGLTFAFGSGDLAEPGRVDAGLEQLAAATVRVIGGNQKAPTAVQVRGATPGRARRMEIVGPAPDGGRWVGHVIVFASDGRLHQAAVLGPTPAQEVVDTYFESIRVGP